MINRMHNLRKRVAQILCRSDDICVCGPGQCELSLNELKRELWISDHIIAIVRFHEREAIFDTLAEPSDEMLKSMFPSIYAAYGDPRPIAIEVWRAMLTTLRTYLADSKMFKA